MKLSDLIRELQPVTVTRSGPTIDPTITRVVADSRAVDEGSLFVAVHGEQRDGHAFIDSAIAKGARAIVAEHPPQKCPVPIVQVTNSRRALARLAAAYYASPADDLTMYAVTGTVGKTSTSLILKHILRASGQSVGVIGSLGIENGICRQPSLHTTPDSLTLQKALWEMRSNQVEAVVMEVSSHALAQDRTHGLYFAYIAMTNLLPLEHLEYHGDFEDYVQTKTRILHQTDENSVIVYQAEDGHLRRLIRQSSGRTVSYGLSDEADVQARRLISDGTGSTFDLHVSSPWLRDVLGTHDIPSLHVPLLGLNNVTNTLAAVTTALTQGVSPAVIRSALTTLRPFKRRLERFAIDGITVIDDTSGHPDSFRHLFSCIQSMSLPSPTLLVAIRGGRGPEINAANAEEIARWYHKLPLGSLVVTAGDDAVNQRDRVSSDEYTAFMDTLRARHVPFSFVRHLREAVEHTLAQLASPGILILAGAQGMDHGARFVRESLSKVQL